GKIKGKSVPLLLPDFRHQPFFLLFLSHLQTSYPKAALSLAVNFLVHDCSQTWYKFTLEFTRGDKALQIKRLCPREQVIHGACELMREDGQCLGCAVFVFQCRKILLAQLVLA